MTLAKSFKIVVADPCDAPVSITASSLEDKEYTITTGSVNYQIPVFMPDPDWCDISYTYTLSSPAGSDVVSFDAD